MPIQASPHPAPDRVRIARALISVFDKNGIEALGKGLVELGVELVSTGGSRQALEAAGLPVRDVSELTGFPEIMGGRVKTLHPGVHAGLLAVRGDPAHAAALEQHGLAEIDLLVVNLYPFEAVARHGADAAEVIENIDIGGPAMIRAAAKNHGHVAVVTDPADYGALLETLRTEERATRLDFRRRLAAEAFARTAAYDAAVAAWFAAEAQAPARFRSFAARLARPLRYGENPHQAAFLYTTGDARPGAATAFQAQGKELSYNNLNDTDAAVELVAEFDPERSAAVVIVKHANPCGVALADTVAEAYQRALACDPVSAFGGIVAVNRRLDADAAGEIVKLFTEVIVAPDADEAALEILASKKNLRLLLTGGLPDPRAPGDIVRSIAGGLLVQSRDRASVGAGDVRVVTRRSPSEREMADLIFAFRVAKHVKSNAIVYARDLATVGVGAGQMSRVDSARIAARKALDAAEAAGLAQPMTRGSVVASDAFFPFADGLLAAVEAGTTAVIQPGGSMRDDEVIEAADAHGLAMVFTGTRHFRH